jgi:hypothetical protein
MLIPNPYANAACMQHQPQTTVLGGSHMAGNEIDLVIVKNKYIKSIFDRSVEPRPHPKIILYRIYIAWSSFMHCA